MVLGAYAAVVAGWWARHVLLSLTRRLDLCVDPLDPRAWQPLVSAIIPARNERDRIAACVRTLLAQGPVVREVIVIDDRSDDGTAEHVHAVAAGDERVRVLRIDALPEGWAGKAHACQCGGALARGDWLLFADADCHFGPGGVAGAVHYAQHHSVDLLSLWLAADNRSFWERMLIPLCGALILYWFPPFRANRPGTGIAYANGQFILVRRAAYQQIGGHASARATVIEDIPLAQYAKRSGLRLRTALGPEVAAVRMYTNFHEIFEGWTRIFIGALQRPWKLLVTVGSLLGGSLLPALGAPVAVACVLASGWPAEPAARFALILVWLHAIAVFSVSFRAWGLCHCARRHLLLYPVSVLIVVAIVLRAWWWMITRRSILWRGALTGFRTSAADAAIR